MEVNKKSIKGYRENNGNIKHIKGVKGTEGRGKLKKEWRCCSRGLLFPAMCHLRSSTKQWLQAYRPGFITLRIQSTSTSAGVRLAMPAQIFSSHLNSCGVSESTVRVYLCSEVQSRILQNSFFGLRVSLV